MTSFRFLGTLLVAALAALGVSCSSTSSPGGSGGSSQQAGGASGGSKTTGTGGSGSGGSGGSTASGGASSAGGAAGGGAGSGGATSSGGSGNGGGGSSGSGAGGTASGGSKAGGASGDAGVGTGGSAIDGGAAGGTSGTGGTSAVTSCPALPGAPTGTAPLPSAAQLSYQRTEMTAFIHFGLSTFDGSEQCSASDPVSTFAPTKLDATSVGQWVTSLKGAGFRQAMLVTKHSCGFVLWPSKYTDYSTKNSTWKGDVLQLWSDAMKANDMRIAIYLSPWDSHYPSSKSDYQTYFTNLLTELYTYGNSYEFEFDGYHSIDQGSSNTSWKAIFQQIHQAQPNTLVWAGPEIVQTGATPDVQWIGNENGLGSRSTSSLDTSNCGGGNTWCPYECNTSSHRPNWFWHPGQNPIALADMQNNYFQTVGMNCTFNFNVPPSNTGEFDPKDIALLQQFGTWYNNLYKTNLLKGQPATADSTWSAAGFEAGKAVDDDLCTYWAAASGKTSGTLTLTPASPITANLISIREAIELGERVKKYHVEIQQNGTWNTSPTDKSGTKIQGTVIGNRQLWQLNGAAVQAVRLVIDSAKDSPTIAEFGVY